MRIFLSAVIAVSFIAVFGFAHAAEKQNAVCLKVNGEKIEIQNLFDKPVVVDREGTPDYVSTSMMKSQGPKSFNILVSGVKRDSKKAINSFSVKIDDKSYAFPKDSCVKK